MSPLTIQLLGPFIARLDGAPLPHLRSRKGQWLIALLTLQAGREVDRVWLAGTLWPESDAPQALGSLRKSLKDLRRAFGQEAGRLYAPTPRRLCLDLAGAEVDVGAFDAAIAQGDLPALEQAVALYRGPLLQGCVEPWVLPERLAREEAYLQARETLAARALADGDAATAERHLRQAIAVDPLRESAQRALMQALAEGGNQAAAVQVYRDLRLLLHRELNEAPDPETTALFQSLRAGSSPVDRRSRVALAAGGSDRRHNLPLQLTRFIGREREMAQVRNLLDTNRLVMLTGPGGCGKTRLALQVAGDRVDCVAGGVWLVELAPLAEPALLLQAVASALGVREEPGQALVATLTAALRDRELLLMLDNCEHLVEGCARLVEGLLQACPRLRLLATSRETLGIPGESCYRTPSLSLPDVRQLPPLEQLAEYEAIQLFLERAQKVMPGFRLTKANALAVAQVCARLDGIPLAIELAAARVRALPVEEIAGRLDDRFSLLTGGSRTALPRHRTLRACIDWSYDLLSEPERVLLRRLSVFSGGSTLEAVEGICTDARSASLDGAALSLPAEGECRVEDRNVLDLLTALVDRSLVIYEAPGGGARYQLLETVRQYSRDRLLEAGEETVLRGRHRDFFLRLAEKAELELRGAKQLVWLERLEAEHDNMRAALAWCLDQPPGNSGAETVTTQADDPERSIRNRQLEYGLRLAGALFDFWYIRGQLGEGERWLERALAMSGRLGRVKERAKAMYGAGRLAWRKGNHAVARSHLQESVTIWRELGDRQALAYSLTFLGLAIQSLDEPETVRLLQEEGIRLFRELGDRYGLALALYLTDENEESLRLFRGIGNLWGTALTLASLARLASDKADYRAAQSQYEQVLALFREVGDRWRIAHTLADLGDIAWYRGDYSRAEALFQESLALNRNVGNRDGTAWVLRDLGHVAREQGDYERARSFYEQSLEVGRELDYRWCIADAFQGLGYLAYLQASLQRAQVLLEESLAIADELGYRGIRGWALMYLAEIADARGDYPSAHALLEESIAIWRELGYRLNLADALARMGYVIHHQGDAARAAALYRESLLLQQDCGTRARVAECLEGMADAAGGRGQVVRAARLFGAAAVQREAIGAPLPPVKRADHESHVASARAALGEQAFATTWAEGNAMTLEEAVRAALAEE